MRFHGSLLLAGLVITQPAVSGANGRLDDNVARRVVRDRAVERHLVQRRNRDAIAQAGDSEPCRDAGSHDDYYRHCEVREETLPAGPLAVNAGRNGGISVHGWDRGEIRVRAVVQTHARSEDRARGLASEVQVQTGGHRVQSTGPDSSRGEWWSVSYRIDVPRQNDLDLTANNGGITIAGVSGTIRFDTSNGGVRLNELAGSVRGRTRNGGLNITLTGDRWSGDGLDVETTNGGVTLAIPDGYNAALETRTVNGSFRTDYPMTVQGELNYRRGLLTTLGSGGAPVRVRTTNGGLRIQRR
jgi:hypothetical protein